MLLSAVEKSEFHLERARASFTPIAGIFSGDFTSQWADFLNAGNSVYEAFLKGSKESPQSRQWFGAQKRLRKTDQLLNYMHQARNASEHGLHSILELGSEPRGMDVLARFHEWETRSTEEGFVAVGTDREHNLIEMQFTPPDYRLALVYDDRSDVWHDPPIEHMGEKLPSNTPVYVGRVWLIFLERMVAEARAHVAPTP